MPKPMKVSLFITYILATFVPLISVANTLSVDRSRILMTDHNRRAEFRVYNTSATVQSLRISLIDKQMDENGRIKTIRNSPVSASSYLRIGPKITESISPSDFQKFRIRVKPMRQSNMPAGEYRSHLLVESINPAAVENRTGVLIRPKIKYSIPIIIRHGKLNAEVTIDKIRVIEKTLENGNKQPLLTFEMTRQGNRSVYGNFILYQLRNGQTRILAELIGQAIYTDISNRRFSFVLRQKPTAGSRLKIEFKENPDFGGNSQTTRIIKV